MNWKSRDRLFFIKREHEDTTTKERKESERHREGKREVDIQIK